MSNLVSVIMGSVNDYEIMKEACLILEKFGIAYEKKVLSAHRMPKETIEFASNADKNGIKIIIAGAGGAAHLAGVVASLTTIPVIGVPIQSKALNGLDSLLSIVQMPAGIPVATMGINGATNAGLLAVSILAGANEELKHKLDQYRQSVNEKAALSGRDL